MFFGAANPDIFEPLKSDLNPTGSIQKQKELNTYFASVQTNPTSGGIGGSDPNAGLMPAASLQHKPGKKNGEKEKNG